MDYKVNSIIAKVANLCNLNCSYCYVFNMGDEHYCNIPNIFSSELCDSLLKRIKEHCLKYELNNFAIVFHGGEPLILGITYYKMFLSKSHACFRNTNIRITYLLQTNGTLMNDEWANFLTSNNIHVGFSLDGDESIHNKNRKYKINGFGSYKDTIRGIEIFKRYSSINVLSVVNPDANPFEFYSTFKKIGVNNLSVLLRDANYRDDFGIDMNKVLEWLIELFNIWFNDKEKDILKSLNPFTVIINLLLGFEDAGNDAYGEVYNNSLLVLTNGEIQVTGVEKNSGTNKTYNIVTHQFDDVFDERIFRDYYNVHKDEVLCVTCQKCLVKSICGGGRLSHRFSVENSFDNPTIYCNVMKKLITHIQNKIVENLPQSLIDKTKLVPLNIEDI